MQKCIPLLSNRWTAFCAAALALLAVCASPALGGANAVVRDLTQLSLEDLMNIRITSVSKKAQRLSDAAAAVFVITSDDIRRSGVTTIADALRMVPGLQVARVDANKWAVTARGFNGRFANKLLVLVDGRSVYTPLFSGVFWETLDMFLDDIARIEVIRGPGASLWGSNAVNGVINIITKKAGKTQGGLAKALAGSEERGTGVLRYGDRLGAHTPFRLWAKYSKRDAAVDAEGDDTADDWHIASGGFRMDSHLSDRDTLLLEGGLFDGKMGTTATFPRLTPPFAQTLNVKDKHSGHHLLTRWQHTFYGDSADMALQFFYDHNDRFPTISHARVDTYDLDFQHRFRVAGRHEIVWGLGYRYIRDDIDDNPDFFSIEPSRRGLSIANAFAQDEISLFAKRLRLTLGSKFEYNDYTHLEIQPTGRILWKPTANQSVWAAVSRAVRTPARGERGARATTMVLPPGTVPGVSLPTAVTTFGNESVNSETVIAYEMGYRFRAAKTFSVDAAAYYNEYRNLRRAIPERPFTAFSPSGPHMVIPFLIGNGIDGQLYGLELAMDWQLTQKIRLQSSYAYTLPTLHGETNRYLPRVPLRLENPRHQISLRAGFDLPHNTTLDLWWRYVDELGDRVDSYHSLDVRLGWKPISDLEISVVGQNLIENHHLEFIPEFDAMTPTEVQRSVYAAITLKF